MKSKCCKFICLSALALLVGAAGQARAGLQWSWGLQDYAPVVGPGDSVVLAATIANEGASTERLTGAQVVNAFTTEVEDFPYTLTVPGGDFLAQFAGMDLDPGESFDFIYAIYVPQHAPVASGTYLAGGMALVVRDAEGALSDWTPDRDLYVTVRDDPPGEPGQVPEPASPALVGVGLYGLWRLRRTRGARVSAVRGADSPGRGCASTPHPFPLWT